MLEEVVLLLHLVSTLLEEAEGSEEVVQVELRLDMGDP